MTCTQLQILADVLTGFGLLAGLIGSLLMANAYFQATGTGLSIWVVVSSLWRDKLARGAARIKGANPENALASLQGVAFVGLAFACQLGSFFVQIFNRDACQSVLS
jgi:hypothetical protein